MSAKSITEADGKAILNYHLTRAPVIKPSPLPKPTTHNAPPRLASLYFPEDAAVEDVLNQAEVTYPWLLQDGAKFVAKPDQLIKRRGKSGLLALNKTWAEAKAWVAERAGKPQKVEHVEGVLRQFLVEPFVPHPSDTEYYININSVRDVSSIPVFALRIGSSWPTDAAAVGIGAGPAASACTPASGDGPGGGRSSTFSRSSARNLTCGREWMKRLGNLLGFISAQKLALFRVGGYQAIWLPCRLSLRTNGRAKRVALSGLQPELRAGINHL